MTSPNLTTKPWRDIETELHARAEVLRPAHEEYLEIERWLKALNGNGNAPAGKPKTRPGPRSARADELVRLVHHRPGKTVKDYGEFMGLFGESYTSLYQPLKRLLAEDQPRIRKEGSHLWPVEA